MTQTNVEDKVKDCTRLQVVAEVDNCCVNYIHWIKSLIHSLKNETKLCDHGDAQALIAELRAEIVEKDARTAELVNDVSYYAARNEELRAQLEQLQAAPAERGVDAYAVADRVRTALDKQACPNAWMVAAYEAVVCSLNPAVQPEPTFCEYCGGNDEQPQDHCVDCTRQLVAPFPETSTPEPGWDAGFEAGWNAHAQESAQQQKGQVWIPVTERLPKFDTSILLMFENGHVEDAQFHKMENDEGWYYSLFDGESLTYHPTHWSPLVPAQQQKGVES